MPSNQAPPIPEAGITLLLPWLDSHLSPNARPHKFQKARLIKQAKHDARMVVLEAISMRQAGDLPRTMPPPIKAQWIFVPPDKRKRDIDNLTSNAGCKAAVDACVMEGLLVDDNSEVLTWGEPEVWRSHPLFKGPGVVLLLDGVEA